MAAIAANFRSTCDSERGAPESITQRFPAAELQVGQATDNSCWGVSSLFFILTEYLYMQSRISSILESAPSLSIFDLSGNTTYQDLALGQYNLCVMSDLQSQPRPMIPWFLATERFDKSDAAWAKYIAWSRLEQLDEIVSLDSSFCPTVLPDIKAEYWNRIVNEDFMLHFFADLDYLRGETVSILRKNLLCVFRNPFTRPNAAQVPEGFEFLGYDLTDKESGTSALTNCGGFPKAFSNAELSEKGLLRVFERAKTVQDALVREYPGEHHADCHLWAIFRAL